MPNTIERGSLYSKTLELLKDSGTPLPEIYKETNIPYYWLKNFSSGKTLDPSVNRVQRLYEFLSGKELGV